jgi:hypothetical protein
MSEDDMKENPKPINGADAYAQWERQREEREDEMNKPRDPEPTVVQEKPLETKKVDPKDRPAWLNPETWVPTHAAMTHEKYEDPED